MVEKNVESLIPVRGSSTTEQLAITRQVVMLQTATAHISESLEEHDVVQTIPGEFAGIFSFDNCTFYTFDSDQGTIELASRHNPNKSPLPDLKTGPQDFTQMPAIADVVKTRKAIHVNQNTADQYSQEWKFAKKQGYKSQAFIPMTQKGRLLGILEVFSKGEISFAPHEFVIIKLFTDHCANAIDHARLYKQVREEVDQRKHAEEKLRHDALHDELTDLPNRTLFNDRLERLILRSKREPSPGFAVLYLDLDSFKLVNDSYGHQTGDEVLIEVATVLQRSVRDMDTVSRFGGDEFLVLLDGYLEADEVRRLADRILNLVCQPIELHGHEIVISASIGIAMPVGDGEKPEDYIRNADIAMYHAKSRGKGRYEIFSETQGLVARERMIIESELRNSIKHMRFLIHYQPIMDLETNQVIGLEALLRWHPAGGEIQLPETFLGHLETIGLMFEVGLWVLREACGNLVAWQEKYQFDPPLTMSVNISNSQVVHPRFLSELVHILEETGMDPNQLIIEITENIFIRDADLVSRIIKKIQVLGIQIHLDDFGTGFSSLGYLNKLPIDAIKIDRSFIQEVVSPEEHRGVINSIIILAHDLGLNVIAEGIEKPVHVEYLEKTGCRYGQGFLFNKGLDPKDIDKLFREQRKQKG